MHVHERIKVDRPRSEIYAFWRNLTQLPLFMEHLVSVEGDPYGVTHWKAKSLIGTVDWDAKVVEDKPDEMISWRSLDESDVRNSGAVRFFETADGGTEIEVDISYDAPMGPIGVAVSKIFGQAPNQEVAKDLRQFKEIMESGVVGNVRAGTTHAQREPDPVAQAGMAELQRSRDATHAVSASPEYEGTKPEGEDHVVTGTGATAGRGPETITYPTAGVVGGTAAATHGVVADESGVPTAATQGVASDIDPQRRGTKPGPDQDTLDGNDRDAADRGSTAPV